MKEWSFEATWYELGPGNPADAWAMKFTMRASRADGTETRMFPATIRLPSMDPDRVAVSVAESEYDILAGTGEACAYAAKLLRAEGRVVGGEFAPGEGLQISGSVSVRVPQAGPPGLFPRRPLYGLTT